MITHLYGKIGGEKMPIDWIKAGIIFFSLFFILYMFIKTAQKQSNKLDSKLHKKDKLYKSRSIG